MAEPLPADLQSTLNAILASIQSVRDENKQLQENLKSVRDDSKHQNKSIHEENKKIFAAVHEQAKQSKSIVEAAEKKITEKDESCLLYTSRCV